MKYYEGQCEHDLIHFVFVLNNKLMIRVNSCDIKNCKIAS